MNEVITSSQMNLPETLPDLSRFVLIGRDKLKAVRAEIHAIDKVGVARDVYQQKLEEAQEIAEVVTDAECRMGELLRGREKPVGNRFRTSSANDTLRNIGITRNQSSQFQLMASHPESVAKAKAKAKEDGTVLSRNAVIDQIVRDTKSKNMVKEMERKAEERHEEFDSSGKTVSFDDIKQDREDRDMIGKRAYLSLSGTLKNLDAYILFKQENVRCIPDAIQKTELIHFKEMIKHEISNLEKVLELLGG